MRITALLTKVSKDSERCNVFCMKTKGQHSYHTKHNTGNLFHLRTRTKIEIQRVAHTETACNTVPNHLIAPSIVDLQIENIKIGIFLLIFYVCDYGGRF